MSDQSLRDDFLAVLNHLETVLTKLTQNSGAAGFLSQDDFHTLAEGLFLYAFTHWEQFTRNLLVEDVATHPGSALQRAVQQFHDAGAPMRLALQILQHPDHPQKFVEWSNYQDVVARANEYLGAGNRFAAPPLPRRGDLDQLKRVRNAIAHRSDKAWTRFLDLCEDPPFGIPPAQMVGMTPGRLLVDYHWHGQIILRETLMLLGTAARHLVP